MKRPEDTRCKLQPILLDGDRGSLVAFYHPPAEGVAPKGDVMLVPAFAEEMNRCRSMVTMQAQALSELGMGSLVLDMRGTGDSPGEFEQADWDGWRMDLQRGIAWLRQHGNGCGTLWGVRLGALMAAQLAERDEAIRQLVFWMPVVTGKTYWTQFLRIRLAAEMGLANGVKSTEELRRRSLHGQVVEASGYQVGPLLAQRLDTLDMPDGDALRGRQVAWFEVSPNEEATMPRANAKLADAWRTKDVEVATVALAGPQFWQVHERAEAPALIRATTESARGWPSLARSASDLEPSAVLGPTGDVAATAEYPVAFQCAGCELAGIIHRGKPDAKLGVVIVVAGGPQYRAGAHRQFVSLGRLFAADGYPVLRFDLRGMGDSSGQHLGYEQSRPDIRAAIDEFMRREPSLEGVALFGECASASGILFYAAQDDRVRKIALTNPWVRTSDVQAEAILKHYYLDRLKSPEFWQKLRQGRFNPGASARSFGATLATYLRGRKNRLATVALSGQNDFDHLPLPSRTAEGLRRFHGPVLFLLSGRDLIAREFDEVTKSSPAWKGLLADSRISRKDIADADHTFSKPEAKAEAQHTLLNWLRGRGTAPAAQ